MDTGHRVPFSRRALIGGLAAGALATTALPSRVFAEPVAAHDRPPKLEAGDLVVVVSPGGPPSPADVATGVALLESWGLRVELGDHVFDNFGGYLAGTDADRLADLNAALAHPEAKAVFASRGGYGTTRIIDDVDFRPLRRRPKLIAGYSDITALHLAVAEHTGIPGLHSPMINWSSNNTEATAESLRRAMTTADPVVLERDPGTATSAVEVPGTACGLLVGGNLSLLDAEPDDSNIPNMDGAILLLEEVNEDRYRIDGMLTRLLRAGVFDGVAAIALGQFVPREDDVPAEGEWTINDVLVDRLGGLGVPILGGLKIGHDLDPRVVPLGTEAVLDTAAGTLTVEAAVRD
jgi:muramoyltetrapeptide carboxypeptidase